MPDRYSPSGVALFLAAFCFVASGLVARVGAEEPPEDFHNLPCWNADLPMEERVADMVGRLQTSEKVALMYFHQPEIPRLGITAYHLGNEALHGVVRPGKATVFPQATGLAATWNPDLIRRMADAISDEARAKHYETDGKVVVDHGGLLTFWSPVVNLARDPRWGRTEETYGEDPYLTGRLGVAFVKGLQGDDPKYLKTVATPKHFAGNNQERDRFRYNVVASESYFRDYELLPYRDCIVEGRAESIMGAYNAINGVPCCANKWLMTDVLRREWGFRGFVVSDCGAIKHLAASHRFVKRLEEASAVAVASGVDLICGKLNLDGAVREGLVTEEALNQSVTRILTARFKLGMFDPSERVPYARIPPSKNGCPEHVALTREVARQCMTLLKNEPVGASPLLPLDASRVKNLVVVGPNAAVCQFGDYSGEPANPQVTPLAGLQARAGANLHVTHLEWKNGDEIAANLDAIRAADVVIAVLGLGRDHEGEARDRNGLNLPAPQDDFAQKLLAENPRLVVVLESGGPLTVAWIADHVPAVLQAWYPGEQGGHAIADVLFGDANPAGRLPLTFHRSEDQLPPLDDYDLTKGRTYQYFSAAPLYPFGHGLSYTRFEYSAPSVEPAANVPVDGKVQITCEIANIGPRDGDEVVQLYVRQAAPRVTRPLKQLKAFERVSLKAGERKTIVLPLTIANLGFWNQATSRYEVDPGDYELQIGASSADIRLKAKLTIAPPPIAPNGKLKTED